MPDDTSSFAHFAVDKTTKILSSVFTGVTAAALTYPAEKFQRQWQTKALSKWSGDEEDIVVKQRSIIKRAISPFLRLNLQELSSTYIRNYAETVHMQLEQHVYDNSVSQNILSGAIAGLGHALILCPLQLMEASERLEIESTRQKSWWHYMKQQVFQGGSTSPAERFSRAYRGIGLLAVREVFFNVTFFPLFGYWGKHPMLCEFFGRTTSPPPLGALLMAGMTSGSFCAILTTPLDVGRLYFWYSGERLSILWGRTVTAPPLSILFRGWTIQALVLGPSFGVVAAVYEYTTPTLSSSSLS